VSRLASLSRRVYRDYLQPERLDELGRLLRLALDCGYESRTLSQFVAGATAPRTLLLRHDVDSDVRRARRMWEAERGLGLVGSWFFRRATWDVAFMRELAAAGCDVGYHYEELAAIIRERGLASAEEARAAVGDARARHRAAVAELRARSGLALDICAAHGDFANRMVGVASVEVLADHGFRAEIGIRLEAYDIEDRVSARATDGGRAEDYWSPVDPSAALRHGEPVVELLLHPRAWGASPVENARIDARRLRDGFAYALRRVQRRLRRPDLSPEAAGRGP
jgi:hypothetical protein